MIIKQIELDNFRIYYGKNIVELAPEEGKNLVIISGDNGFGKTTFLMSLVWCLYGSNMSSVDDMYKQQIQEHGGYGKYIGTSLNRTAQKNGESKFSVAVTFTDVDIPDITCTEITVKRSYDAKTNIDDELEILIDGRVSDLFSGSRDERMKEEELFIRDYILPIEIAKFFFFDAEKIVSFAQINTVEQRKELSKAYSQVLGIQKYEDLRNEIERIQDDYRKDAAKPEDKGDFQRAISDINTDEELIKDNQNEIAQLEIESGIKDHEISEMQEKLVREGDLMTIEAFNELLDKRAKLEENRRESMEGLRDLFNYIPFGLCGGLVSELLKQLDDEKAYSKSQVQMAGVDEKTEAILNELEIARTKNDIFPERKIVKFYEEQITCLIKEHFFNVGDMSKFENFSVLHGFSDVQLAEFSTLVSKIKNSKTAFEQLQREYEKCNGEIFSIDRKIREAEKNRESEYVQELRQKLDSLKSEQREISEQIGKFKRDCEEANDRIIANKKRKEVLSKKIQVSNSNKAVDTEASRVIAKIQQFLMQFKEEKKRSLETSLERKLKTYLHKKDLIDRVIVDINTKGDDVDINLYDFDQKKIDKSNLSMGERQMFASALLSALVDETDIEFPVFIDSPMQKFDTAHTKNALTLFYPEVSKQVILFPLLKKELTEVEYGYVKNLVSKTYLINNSSEGSSFECVDPENLFDRYNTRNHAD